MTEPDQLATQLPRNSMRRTFRLFLAAGLAFGLLSACSLAAFAGLALSGAVSQSTLISCPGMLTVLAGLVSFLMGVMAVWARGQAAVVDDLLAGKNRLGYWRWSADENNRPQPGYAYIGRDGVYKDGFYYFFKSRNRQLISVKYAEGMPPTLVFVYRVISRPSSRSSGSSLDSRLIVPVPPGQEDQAQRVAAEFSRG